MNQNPTMDILMNKDGGLNREEGWMENGGLDKRNDGLDGGNRGLDWR